MMKTNPLLLETIQWPFILKEILKKIPWTLRLEKTQKKTKIFKKLDKKFQKLVSFWVFVFVTPKHIAHKKVIRCNFVSQKTFIIF